MSYTFYTILIDLYSIYLFIFNHLFIFYVYIYFCALYTMYFYTFYKHLFIYLFI